VLPEKGYDWPYIRDEQLPEAMIARIKACAKAITRDSDALDDIVQEVQVGLLRLTRAQWDQIEFKEGYVIHVARNASRTWLREQTARNSRHEKFMWHEQHKTAGPVKDLSGPACAAEDLARFLQPLGVRCAEAYIRVRFWGQRASEVALVMHIKVSTVKKHLERAELYFMELLEEEDRKTSSIRSRFASFLKRGGLS
jgi:RNA polymerase sigma factor (sigma-70 family)